MNIKSLEQLKSIVVDGEVTRMFDLTEATYVTSTDVIFFQYVVPRHREMRMDLISYDIYASTDFTDFLMYLNGKINPFQVREGEKIIFVSPDVIAKFYAPKENEEEVQQIFLNKSKTKRKDKKRDKFIEEKRAALPPTVNEVKNEQVKIDGDSLIIGGDIFNV
ncbi:MAG: hypothetical protein SLAVMIC_00595 [uncultured marine phage]|uniref:Uncharacterized protein n=1 Tax=uncultured marine phage TaxID=707152 RepID=A0A8D9CBU0_9VIRU|nr:MAG: hypothetical protein SLAVMIC_00595 [uncultured marine phage]